MSNNFINDCISKNDYLGYLPYIEAFEYLIYNHTSLMHLPVVFGVHGKWGVGKSTFMHLIKQRLDNSRNFFTIELNPWEYGDEKNFVATFLAKLYKTTEDDLCNEEKMQNDRAITLFKSIIKPLKLATDFKLGKIEYDFSKLSFESKKTMIDEFITENYELKESIKYILDAEIFEEKKVVVFIDDLDRCPSEKVMEVIESIKLVLNSENCIFFLGCDKDYIENALSIKYEKFIMFLNREENNIKTSADILPYKSNLKDFAREYLEKIIQVPFNIPPLNKTVVRDFINCIISQKIDSTDGMTYFDSDLFADFVKELNQEFITKLTIEAELNPRRIKRILNLIFLNYIFIRFKFKNDILAIKDIDINILCLLGFIRDVAPEYYRNYLSSTIMCKNVMSDFYSYCKDKKQYDEFNETKTYLLDTHINEYFKIFFEHAPYRSNSIFSNKLKDIEMYISVSNTTTSEDYMTDNWGSIGELRSFITKKKLSTFLTRLKNNEFAQDFVIWFFQVIYNESNYVFGLQRNIHLYKIVDNSDYRDFMFRLEYNDDEKCLYIKFDWANYKSIYLPLDDKLKRMKNYNTKSKQLILNESADQKLVNQIKTQIEELVKTSNS